MGSLLGVVCIVLIGQMGYVASLSGLIMAVCALKGYELLGGRLSGKGIMVSCVLILAMTYVGNNLGWAISAASVLEIGVLEAFRSIGYFLERGVIEFTAYWGDLIMLYLFTLVGAVPTIVSGLRERELPAIPRDRPAAGGQGESDAQGGEMRIYAPAKGWMRRLRVSCCAAVFLGLFLGLGLGVGLPLSGVSEPEVALIAAAALNGAADDGFPLPGASDSRPENTNSYEYHGVTYRVDSAFEEIGENVFFDAKTAAFYYLTVETGMDEDGALSTLTELIGDHRMDPAFDRFQFSYLDEPSILVPLTAADGAIYQHTILSLYFTGEAGEMVIHSGIALSEDGVLVTAGATHVDCGDVETVKTGIVHILQSVVRSDAAADRGFDG